MKPIIFRTHSLNPNLETHAIIITLEAPLYRAHKDHTKQSRTPSRMAAGASGRDKRPEPAREKGERGEREMQKGWRRTVKGRGKRRRGRRRQRETGRRA